jgi:NADPH:quinone reductase-like Zn-dependent oxidoreductase
MIAPTIRRARIVEHGPPEVLQFESIALPQPGRSEVRVRIEAIALNHLDLWVRRGVPGAKFPLPIVPGSDGAGTIEALGEGVEGLSVGDPVFVFPGIGCGYCAVCLDGRDNECAGYRILGETTDGTCSEALIVPARAVAARPAGLDAHQAAAFALTFLTAWNMLVHKARIEPGDRILIHAAASGVSSAAIQIARHLGALIVATASTPEKRELATRLGADLAVPSQGNAWTEPAKRWARQGFDVVFDHVGADTFAPSLRALRKGGRYVLCGATSGFEMKTDFRLVFFKNLEILGSTMGRSSDLPRIAALFAAGRFEVAIDRVFPFSQLADAHRHLESRSARGKVIVTLD